MGLDVVVGVSGIYLVWWNLMWDKWMILLSGFDIEDAKDIGLNLHEILFDSCLVFSKFVFDEMMGYLLFIC
jgi:hypothetical protein